MMCPFLKALDIGAILLFMRDTPEVSVSSDNSV